jgi:cytochrome oxidase Cu insertion factor (SCO1/SenC/PrrC family)
MAKKNTAGRIKVLLAFLLLFGPALILIFISTRGCEHKFKVLEDYGKAVNYSFTDADGSKRSYKDFKDKVVLVNTLQATCPNECAVSFWHMDQLIYQKIRKNKKEVGSVRIISFVTDGNGEPVDDLESVRTMLEDQVEGYDPEIWILASGDSREMYNFENNNKSLLQKGEEYFGGEAYQELLLLLDRKNHLRMVHSGKSEGMIRRMMDHIGLLQKQYDKATHKKK